MRSWEEMQQQFACKSWGDRYHTCPERWPYKPHQWCRECQEAANVSGAGTVIPSGSSAARAQALERRVPPLTYEKALRWYAAGGRDGGQLARSVLGDESGF